MTLSRQWRRWDVVSNLSYLVAALIVAHSSGPVGWVFIATMAFLTAGSAAYHAGVPKANHLDVSAMYAVGIAVWLFTIAGPGWLTAIAMLALAVPGAYLLRMEQLDVPMIPKVGALFGVLYATAFLFHGPQWQLFASLGTMLLALAVRFKWDNPRSHGWWHLLAATGLGLLWLGLA